RRGAHIRAQGIYRDPVRSSRSHVVKASGLRWLSLMLLTPIGWVDRVWALPFMSVLCPSQRYYTQQGRCAVSLVQRAQSMLHVAAGWLPGRRIVVVADSSFAALAFLDAVASYVTVVTRLRLDAALYAPAPPRSAHQVGRPRCKGARLPALQHHLDDPDTPWQTLNPPSLVWPQAAHRGGLFPNRRLVSHRLAARADSMAADPRSTPHLCPPSVAIDSSEPVAPADADVFYTALGGRNHL
ncbi:MAG: transposase, partial [Candidatus Latescibacteria bacterium]|nr:transposase [Candidatus Latescibacterota bacterium]